MRHDMHESNRARWDAAADTWARGADARGLWRRCPAEPGLVLSDRELAHLTGIAGKRACVLGLATYYAEAARILAPGGRFIVAEYHPG